MAEPLVTLDFELHERGRYRITPTLLRGVVAGFCICAAIAGMWLLIDYSQQPGSQGEVPVQWPQSTALPLAKDRPTLLMFLHPHCPCSRSTLAEAESLLEADARADVIAVFVRPSGTDQGWERGTLWNRVQADSRITAVVDGKGTEARQFGAETSGFVCLFGPDGRRQFAGGITAGRGHVGENEGRTALSQWLKSGRSRASTATVFGCPLFSQHELAGAP